MTEEYYFVDFKDVKCDADVHKALKEGLKFKEYYGANLDALWDRLTDMVNYNAVIILQNFDRLEKMDAEEADLIFQTFVSLKHYSNDFFYERIKIFISRQGETEEIL